TAPACQRTSRTGSSSPFIGHLERLRTWVAPASGSRSRVAWQKPKAAPSPTSRVLEEAARSPSGFPAPTSRRQSVCEILAVIPPAFVPRLSAARYPCAVSVLRPRVYGVTDDGP